MREKAESGWFPLNHLPLGYAHQKLKDEEGRELKRGTIIVPDYIEKNVRQVRREFELRVQHGVDKPLSLSEIRKQIIAENYIPPQQGPELSCQRHREAPEK